MKTRNRIIDVALGLFNARGYGAVTTAILAQECGIAEGNLWYHFKTKRALLEAIALQFAQRVELRLTLKSSADDPIGSYCRMITMLMQEQRDYRFIYRDQPSYGEHAEPVASNVSDWLRRSANSFEEHFAALIATGHLDFPRERLADLAINVTLILRYGLEFYSELGSIYGGVSKSLHRHLTLFEDCLSAEASAQLHLSIAQIEEGLSQAA